VPFATTQDVGHRFSLAFSTQVDFGAESAMGLAKHFTVLTSTCPCGALMGTDDCAIHKVLGAVDLALPVRLSRKSIEDALPDSFSRPVTKAAVNRGPLPESFWNVSPGGTCSQDSEDPADDQMMAKVWSAMTGQWQYEWSKALALGMGDLFSAQPFSISRFSESLSLGLHDLASRQEHQIITGLMF